jgi:hypothetical protein
MPNLDWRNSLFIVSLDTVMGVLPTDEDISIVTSVGTTTPSSRPRRAR